MSERIDKTSIVLVSMGENEVQRYLSNREDVVCHFINLDKLEDFSVSHFLQLLEHNLTVRKVDLLLTYRCPFIIPRHLCHLPPLGGYNIHPSLLPNYRGMNPWEEIFRDKVSLSGVTFHTLETTIDAGRIIVQESFPILPTDDITSARHRADKTAARLIPHFLHEISQIRESKNID